MIHRRPAALRSRTRTLMLFIRNSIITIYINGPSSACIYTLPRIWLRHRPMPQAYTTSYGAPGLGKRHAPTAPIRGTRNLLSACRRAASLFAETLVTSPPRDMLLVPAGNPENSDDANEANEKMCAINVCKAKSVSLTKFCLLVPPFAGIVPTCDRCGGRRACTGRRAILSISSVR